MKLDLADEYAAAGGARDAHCAPAARARRQPAVRDAPTEIGKLANLQVLWLQYSQLSGVLPTGREPREARAGAVVVPALAQPLRLRRRDGAAEQGVQRARRVDVGVYSRRRASSCYNGTWTDPGAVVVEAEEGGAGGRVGGSTAVTTVVASSSSRSRSSCCARCGGACATGGGARCSRRAASSRTSRRWRCERSASSSRTSPTSTAPRRTSSPRRRRGAPPTTRAPSGGAAEGARRRERASPTRTRRSLSRRRASGARGRTARRSRR